MGSWEQQIRINQAAIQKILSDAKKIEELGTISNIKAVDEMTLSQKETGETLKTTLQDLIFFLSEQLGYLFKSSTKQIFTASQDQTVFVIQTIQDNVDVIVNRTCYVETDDYAYDSSTGTVTLVHGVPDKSKVEVRGYQGVFSRKERLTIDTNAQISFILDDKPKNIDLNLNRTHLLEGTDYSYTQSTGTITMTNGVNLGSILTVRKIY